MAGQNAVSTGKKHQGKTTPSKHASAAGTTKAVQRSSGGRAIYTLLWLIPLISIMVLTWMFVLNMGYIDSEEMFGWDNNTWFTLSVLIVIILIIVLSLSGTSSLMTAEPVPASRGSSRSREQKGVVIEAVNDNDRSLAAAGSLKDIGAKPESKKEAVKEEDKEQKVEKAEATLDIAEEKEVAAVKPDTGDPSLLVYPTSVGIGLYGDTYIKLDKERMLKLRTLLIEDYYLV